MDNVSFHHSEPVSYLLETVGINVIYLPAYSPDLNPIEEVFSMIKQRLDKLRPRAKSKKELIENIEKTIGSIERLDNFYKKFWDKINKIYSREME